MSIVASNANDISTAFIHFHLCSWSSNCCLHFIKWHSSYFQPSHALNHFDSSAEIWMTFIGYKSNLLSSLSVQTPESEQIVLADFLAACSLENTVNKKCALSGARQLLCSWLLPHRYRVTVVIALENQCSFRLLRHIINEHDYRHTVLPYRCEVRRCFWVTTPSSSSVSHEAFYFSPFTAAFIVIGCPSQTKGLTSRSRWWCFKNRKKMLNWGFWANSCSFGSHSETLRLSSGGRAGHPLIRRVVIRCLAAPVYMPNVCAQDTDPRFLSASSTGMHPMHLAIESSASMNGTETLRHVVWSTLRAQRVERHIFGNC